MKTGTVILLAEALLAAGLFGVDRYYTANFENRFKTLEKQRIVISNKLATAKIVHENLNHVRDLVFKNMDFPGQPDTLAHETHFFDFATECVNDLKMKLVSVKPARPATTGRVTTYGYDIEVAGDFFKFGELCSKFENSRRIISLETFDVNLISDAADTRAADAGRMGIRVKMRLNTYRVSKI